MPFDEEAWLDKVEKSCTYDIPDAKTCVSFLKELFAALESSYAVALNARIQAAHSKRLFTDAEETNHRMHDANDLENKYRAKGDKAFEGDSPGGVPTPVAVLGFYYELIGGLSDLADDGKLGPAFCKKNKTKDDSASDGQKEHGKGDVGQSSKDDGARGGSILTGSRPAHHGGWMPEDRAHQFPGADDSFEGLPGEFGGA